MVVRFFPSEEERNESRRGSERSRRSESRAVRPSDGIAPVTRLSFGSAPADGESEEGSEQDARPEYVSARRAAAKTASALAPLGEGAPSERLSAALAAVRAVAEGDEARSAADRAAEKATRRANNVSIHQLARRGLSRWELERVLERREVEPQTAQAELDRLESVGLLDDAALAVSIVYAEQTRKGRGRQAIEQELRRRHISAEIIEEALSELDGDDEQERAIALAVKRVSQLSAYDDETVRRRLTGFLSRKGYSGDAVRAGLAAAFAARR